MTAERWTIGRLAREAGLARGTLLHYERLGLLPAAGRSEAGYRLYGDDARERLQVIRRCRDAGLTLAEIAHWLEVGGPGGQAGAPAEVAALLESRLAALGASIEALRDQQRRLALLRAQLLGAGPPVGKSAWVALLRRCGFDDEAMRRWHAEFEAADADGHARFLRALGLDVREVADLRRRAREAPQ